MISNILILMTFIVHDKWNLEAIFQGLYHRVKFLHDDVRVRIIFNSMGTAIDEVVVVRIIEKGVGFNSLSVIVDEDVLHNGH